MLKAMMKVPKMLARKQKHAHRHKCESRLSVTATTELTRLKKKTQIKNTTIVFFYCVVLPYGTLWYLMVPYGTIWYHKVP